jgi:hypothetical protein
LKLGRPSLLPVSHIPYPGSAIGGLFGMRVSISMIMIFTRSSLSEISSY